MVTSIGVAFLNIKGLPRACVLQLLHQYLLFLIREIQNNDDALSRFFYLRSIFIARKYSEYIDLRRLRDEVSPALISFDPSIMRSYQRSAPCLSWRIFRLECLTIAVYRTS